MKSSSQKLLTLTIIALWASGTITQCTKKDNALSVQQAVDNKAPSSNAVIDGGTCKHHSMCEPGAACIDSKCKRVDNISCENDSSCPEFNRCYQGRCADCGSDNDCSPGLTCNPQGICVPSDPKIWRCESSADCDNGQICHNGLCTSFCTSGADCSEDPVYTFCASKNDFLVGICSQLHSHHYRISESCNADSCSYQCRDSGFVNGDCYPIKCTQNDECNYNDYNDICIDNRCQPCKEDKHCGDGKICEQGKCNDYGCLADVDCEDENDKCLDHRCTFVANNNANDQSNINTKSPECTYHTDCESGRACLAGNCIKDRVRYFCSDNSACPSGSICNTFYHECFIPKTQSTSKLDKVFQSMEKFSSSRYTLKVEKECMHNADCEGNLICDGIYKCGCMSNQQCGSHQMCNEQLKCECTSNDGCGQGFICTEKDNHSDARKCLCTNDEACGAGKFCNNNGDCIDESDAVELYYHATDFHYGYIHSVNIEKATSSYTKSEKLGNPLATIQLALIEYDKTKDAKTAETKIQTALKAIDEAETLAKNTKNSELKKNDLYPTIQTLSILNYSFSMQYLKAMLKIRGVGIKKDVKGGLQELEDIAPRHALARYELANRYLQGKDVVKDNNKVISILNTVNNSSINVENAYGYYQIARMVFEHPELYSVDAQDEKHSRIMNSLSSAATCRHLDAEYQYAAFMNLFSKCDGKDCLENLSHAAESGHEQAAKRLELVKSVQDVDVPSMKDDELAKQAMKGNIQACAQLSKKHKADACANVLTKEGLMVGDYIKFLSNKKDG